MAVVQGPQTPSGSRLWDREARNTYKTGPKKGFYTLHKVNLEPKSPESSPRMVAVFLRILSNLRPKPRDRRGPVVVLIGLFSESISPKRGSAGNPENLRFIETSQLHMWYLLLLAGIFWEESRGIYSS